MPQPRRNQHRRQLTQLGYRRGRVRATVERPARQPAHIGLPHVLRENMHRRWVHPTGLAQQILSTQGGSHWLAARLNTYLADNDEYRAALRHLLHQGGTITYTTNTITATLDTPATPKITRTLRLLLDELNTTPPHIPGDHRPITYKIKTA